MDDAAALSQLAEYTPADARGSHAAPSAAALSPAARVMLRLEQELGRGGAGKPVLQQRWWVLHTRARQEKRVAEALLLQGITHFLPLVTVKHTYAKRKVAFQIPLFAGYVFLCGRREECDSALRTNRVANVIDVTDQERLRQELRHIYQVVERGHAVELFPGIQVGRRCRIRGGGLKGVEGVVAQSNSRCRVFLSVSILGQSAVVDLDPAMLDLLD